jgi:predicted AAA+ superfamily ATPase
LGKTYGLLQSFSSYPTGSVLENAVLTQIRPNVKSIQYYQKRNGKEIDFIVDQEIALEVKETGTKEDLHVVEKLAISLGLKEWYIITRNYVDLPGFIPAYMV